MHALLLTEYECFSRILNCYLNKVTRGIEETKAPRQRPQRSECNPCNRTSSSIDYAWTISTADDSDIVILYKEV